MFTYIRFSFLYGTRTQKVEKRTEKPITAPAHALKFMFFDLETNMPNNMANELETKDMINPSEWKDIQRETAMARP